MRRLIPACFILLVAFLFVSEEIQAQMINIVGLSKTDLSCNGSDDGTITIAVTGGTKPYVYHLNDGVTTINSAATNDTTFTFTNVWADFWIVFVGDVNNIADFSAILVDEPPPLSLTSQNLTPITCKGFADGKITVTAAGESSSFIYTLNPTLVTNATGVFSGLGPDTYSVTVSDATGCTTSASTGPMDLSDPAVLSVGSATSADIICNGQNNGTVTVSGNGGTGAYSYFLNPGAVTNGSGSFTGLSPGNYTVTITDANSCPSVTTVVLPVEEPAVLSGSVTGQTDVLCFGAATGSVTVSGSGGVLPYSFNIDGGAFGAPSTFNGITGGAHTVRVRDANSCTAEISVNILHPAAAVSGVIQNQTNLLCNSAGTGSVTVNGAGGTGPYTFNIDGGAYGGSGTFNGLSAGAHTVGIKDVNLCAGTKPVTITEPAVLSVAATDQTNVLCFGESTGSVTVAGSGGTAPYTYTTDGITFNGTGIFPALAAGALTIQAVDAHSCTASTIITITQPASAVSVAKTAQTNVLCFGGSTGSVTVAGSGGTAPYTYNVDGGAFGGSGTFNGLIAGPHTFQTKDANGCTDDISVTITQPASALSGAITVQNDLQCFGTGTGDVTIAGSGGTAPFNYSLDGGPLKAAGNFAGLAVGAYTVTVSDAGGCTFDVPVTITQPPILTGIISSQTNAGCSGSNDGSVTIDGGGGGTPPYTYSIDGGPFGASGTFSGLTAGSYALQVKDSHNCTSNVPVTITEPSGLSVAVTSQTNALCFGSATGTATVSGSGGTSPYTYNIDGGAFGVATTFPGLAAGSHTVLVSDVNGCTSPVIVTITEPAQLTGSVNSQTDLLCFGAGTGSVTVGGAGGTLPYTYNIDGGAFGASGTFSALSAGNHTVKVKDSKTCTADVPVSITEPAELVPVINITDASCNGFSDGSATILASGGTGAYSYSLSPFAYQGSNVFAGLPKNNYTFSVKDGNGCVVTRTVALGQPQAINIVNELVFNDNICFGDSLGEIRIFAPTGGVAPFVYSIDGGLNFAASGTFTELPAGNYQTTIKDSHNCLKNGNLNTITQPPRMQISSYSQVDVSQCFGNVNGSIGISASGGTGVITYDIDGIENNITGVFDPVSGGDHTITITDEQMCSFDTTVTLSQPSEIIFSGLVITDVTGCTGGNNGSVTAVASGGAGPYMYSFNGGAFEAGGNYTSLTAGSYSLSAQDTKMCVKDTVIVVSEPAPVGILSQLATNVSCFGMNDGNITVTGSGGSGVYTYILNPGAIATNNTGVFGSLAPGAYSINVTDDLGCGPFNSAPVSITEPAALSRDSVVTKDISCNGSNDGEIHIYGSGGTIPYSFSYDDEGGYSTNADSVAVAPGTYHLSLLDDNGCHLTLDTIILTDPPALATVSENKTDIISCSYDSTGEVSFLVSGGTGSIEYSLDSITWQPSGNFTLLPAGNYMVRSRDANMCLHNSSVLHVFAPQPITADITTTPELSNQSKGSISITGAGGGTGVLSYSITGTSGSFSNITEYEGLDAGTYPVAVKDANNCFYTEDAIVVFIPSLDVTVALANSACQGDNQCSVIMTCTNGTAPVEYSIDDSASWTATGSFTDLPPGTYKIFVRDGLTRYFGDTVLLTEPEAINILGSIIPASCSSFSNDGSVNVSVNGGTAPYDYLWSGGETSQDLTAKGPGDYTLTVTDANSCSNFKSFNLPALVTVNADAGRDTALCIGQKTFLFGQGGANLSWSPDSGLSDPAIANPEVTILHDQQYILTVTGFSDCIDKDTVNIIVHPFLGLSAGNDTSITYNTVVELVASGGPYTSYLWAPATGLESPEDSVTIAHPGKSTSYIITAVTEFGCTETDTVNVKVISRIVVFDAFSPNGDGVNDYFDIDNGAFFPDMLVEVYTRWGEKIFSTRGYSDDRRWDGTYKGKNVPMGTYYYVIVPYKGAEAITGPLTIFR
jgi:large repetitive protein